MDQLQLRPQELGATHVAHPETTTGELDGGWLGLKSRWIRHKHHPETTTGELDGGWLDLESRWIRR